MVVSLRGLRSALDCTHDPDMRSAAAEIARQRVLDLVFGRVRVCIQQGLRLHDHAVDAVAALDRLLVDESLLQRMRMRRAAEAFQRGHLTLADTAHRVYA